MNSVLPRLMAVMALLSLLSLIPSASAQELLPAVEFQTLAATTGELWPADFNRDGVTDVVVQGTSGKLETRLGRGDGTFGSPIVSSTTGRPLATGDVNRDGRTDVLAVLRVPNATSDDLVVVPGNGDGTLGTPRVVRRIFRQAMFALLADLDNNAAPDVAVGFLGETFEMLFLAGNGDFTFGPDIWIASGGEEARAAVAADVNGDGLRDVAVAHTIGGTWLLLNRGGFAFEATNVQIGQARSTDVTARDVNGDGFVDLVTSGRDQFRTEHPWTEGYAIVTLGNGDGTFRTESRYQVPRGANSVVVGDFTHDGVTDVATTNHSYTISSACWGRLFQNANSLSILPGRGDGTFGDAVSFALDPQRADTESVFIGASLRALNTSDLNRDGFPDLLVGNQRILLTIGPRANRPPTAVAPDDHRVFSGLIPVHGTASDPDGHFLLFDWSTNSSGHLYEAEAHEPAACFETDVYGRHTFQLTVFDPAGASASDTVTIDYPAPTEPPVVTITAPADGARLTEGVPVTIRWTVTDDEPVASVLVNFATTDGPTYSIDECRNAAGQCTWVNPRPASTGHLMVSVMDSTGSWGFASVTITVEPAGTLPSGWANRDVGAVAAPGGASYNSSGTVFTIRGSGADIWDTADEFHWAYRTLSGDFTIVARVASIQNVNQWTKAGLMIRETLVAGSRHASLFATPTTAKGVAFQRRATTNGTSVHTAGPPTAPPVWLLLQRAGDEITASYRLSESVGWTFIGRQTIAGLAPTVHAGLAVSSHVDGQVASATFDKVTVTQVEQFAFADVGAVGHPGSLSIDVNGLTIEGSGADIWNNADAFSFYYRNWSGDGSITIRVRSIAHTHAWAKAGVMFRESLAAGSKHVMAIVSPAKGLAMQYRAATNGSSVSAAPAAGAAPEWLRLTRAGNTFTGFASEDGSTWRTLGSITISMNANVLVGLPVTSHDNATRATAVFGDWPRVQ